MSATSLSLVSLLVPKEFCEDAVIDLAIDRQQSAERQAARVLISRITHKPWV